MFKKCIKKYNVTHQKYNRDPKFGNLCCNVLFIKNLLSTVKEISFSKVFKNNLKTATNVIA